MSVLAEHVLKLVLLWTTLMSIGLACCNVCLSFFFFFFFFLKPSISVLTKYVQSFVTLWKTAESFTSQVCLLCCGKLYLS